MGNDDDTNEPKAVMIQQVVMVGDVVVNQEEDLRQNQDIFFDDRTGKKLDSELVKLAEKEEMDFMEEMGVGEEADEQECWDRTGKAPVTTKFVRVNKATDEDPDVRARLCGRDFKVKGDDHRYDVFASMPPLEAKKMLFRQAAKDKRRWRGGRWERRKILLVDVKKAHLNGKVPKDLFAYVKLPCGKVWRLRRWLYGMRPAANAWEADCTQKLESVGFVRGKSAPTVFFREATGCRCVVHGGDFTFLSFEEDVRKIVKDMKGWYDIKVRGILGEDEKDDKEVTILNRRLTWKNNEIEYEADQKHVKKLMEDLGLDDGSKGLEAPAETEVIPEGFDPEDEEEASLEEATRFRGLAATANFLSLDRMDIQFATKEICRCMAKPTARGWQKLKRLRRFLKDHPRMIWKFNDADGPVCKEKNEEFLDVYSDSDWAGDRVSRKSTSGGVISFAGCAIKHWSSTQSTIATSSGEAEYYAMVKAVAEGLAVQALASDLGLSFQLRIWVDSTAAKAIVSRIGLGKVRHMEVKYLWAQEALKNGRFRVMKVDGTKNPADILTKPKTAKEMGDKLLKVGGRIVEGGKTLVKKIVDKPRWSDMCEEMSE